MARTPKPTPAAKAKPAPDTAPKSPAPQSGGETNEIPQGASGTAREAPSADSGADTEKVSAGVQPAPPHNSEGQPQAPDSAEAQHAEPEAGDRAAPEQEHPSEAPSADVPEPGTGEAGETGAAARSPADLPREQMRKLERAGLVKALASFEPDDDLSGRLRFLDVEIEVLAWDLGPHTLVIVSTAGRKYTIDRKTGAAIDTATGEVLL